MVKNVLEDVEFVEPQLGLPIPDGMCKNCTPTSSEPVVPVIDGTKI